MIFNPQQFDENFLEVIEKSWRLETFKSEYIHFSNGKYCRIPLIGEVGLENLLALSEPWMTALLQKLISHRGFEKLFVDVGVNIGQILLKIKSINGSIGYVGFEPNPIGVNYIDQLIKIYR